MGYISKRLLILAALCLLTNCGKKNDESLKIKAKSIDAVVEGDILKGESVLNDPDRFVWGASVIKGEDGKYHMFYSTWECGDSIPKFTDSWVLHSKIAYAVSDEPDKNFKFQKIVLQGKGLEGDSIAWDTQMVHNPHIKRFENKYYLYYLGSKDPGIQPQGSKGEKLNKRNRVQQNQQIGVIEFNTFDDLVVGNFTRPTSPLLSPRTRVKPDNIVNPSPDGTTPKPDNIIVVNPSVVKRPSDGKFLLYFKGNFYNPHWRGVHGVAIADSPNGPFTTTDNFVFDFMDAEGKIASAEDPYVWHHPEHKKFYSVVKDFSGLITEGKPGLALLESLDGIKWTKPINPFFMKKEVVLNSGDSIKVNRLERPQLLIDENGNPTVLYAACSIVDINPRQDGASFNVHIPLKITK
ncbi:glycoside hydrolase family protein [Aureibaculum sp. 2210JD6-5]|uniref:glycoside hydrolase family protein n=1 Tax=Aureibaculum sp. 2210JD6-5 TaxID=3103957 RepID=UPI002AAD6781|nr:glycoside hydrolase family protein [Aureibaculum sp. 2210JD6-5]MDY7395081.1 glycoside hydrolase family protein [Aureibaculum sp. 2210JD6-5]